MTGPGNTLADIPFLTPLDESARSALEQRARWVRYTANDTIIDRETESRDVYFVVEGRVRVVNFSISGREITFDEMTPGGVFGEGGGFVAGKKDVEEANDFDGLVHFVFADGVVEAG
ncbi:MAG: cyclic nucleotide-binding domain-containing protein, partial [Rhodospirillaceae bacterium]|nr:cyclic nucleotide-binding domain-containing protein [Rhodospirillaceae bacterium]